MIFKNKIIAKSLILSLFTSTLYIPSMAYEEIPNRYQTLEGEHIVIDDSTEGELHEIEIFGNTIQDENNLENIQSVGDLYIDEDGNPILDSQGREQYKVDIFSSNRLPIIKDEWNTWLKKDLIFSNRYSGAVFNTFGYTKPGDHVRIHLKLKKISEPHNFSNPIALTSLDSGGYNQALISNSEWINLPVGESIEKTVIRTINLNTGRSFVSLQVGQAGENTDPTSNTGTFIIEDVGFDIMSSSTTEIKEYKTTILLPTQLQKVGDVSDKLYYDKSSNNWYIKKNISSTVLTLDKCKNTWRENNPTAEVFNVTRFVLDVKDSLDFKIKDKKILNTLYPYSELMEYKHDTVGIYTDYTVKNRVWIHIDKSELAEDTVEECRKWLTDRKPRVYYQIATSKKILLPHETQNQLNIFLKNAVNLSENISIYTESKNRVNPTLKVTTDRIGILAREAVEEFESNPNSKNLELARNIVNQIEESLFKDQLQDRLNIISSIDDLTLERKISSANLDIYIKSENLLSLSIDTNSIAFDNFGGVEDMEKLNAVNLTVNSSLPYEVNAYLASEIQNSDKSNTMNKDILNIKANSEARYNTFTDIVTPIVLLNNQPKGNDITHGIDIKLKGGIAHEKDVYKTTIKFEVKQK